MDARPPFTVPVPPIGDFTFRRMTPRLRLKIEAEAARMSAGIEGRLLRNASYLVVFLETVIDTAPEGFDLSAMDPADAEDYARMLVVEDAWCAEDARFRGRPWPPRPAVGQGAQPDGGVPVPEAIRPSAD